MSGTNPVLTLSVEDQVSPGAKAASDALVNLANSADLVETKVRAASDSGVAFANKWDPATKATTAFNKAQTDLSRGIDAMGRDLTAGKITQDQYSGAVANAQAKVRAASEAVVAAGPPLSSMAAAHAVAADAAERSSTAHAGFTRELVILGHEVVSGNFSRIPGSMVVLAERSGNLEDIVKGIGSALVGWPGIMAGAAIGLGVLAVSAETSERRILALQTALRATRADFEAAASEANLAARGVAGSGSGIALPDATAAAQALVSNPAFQGSKKQLQDLIGVADNLAVVMGETLPAEAAKLAAAMDAPGKMAEELATKHFPGMNAELARSIDLQAQSGDKAGAYANLLDVVSKATSGAAKASKTELQVALDDLKSAFVSTGSGGKSFGETIGSAFDNIVSRVVTGTATVINSLTSAGHWLDNHGLGIGTSVPGSGGLFGGSPSPSGQVSPSIAPALAAAAQSNGLDLNLLSRLQLSEGAQNPDGSWQTSPTGAMGPMQVVGTTFRGISPGGDPMDPTQNISAGAQLFAHLLNKYGDPTLAVLAYHDGETKIDQVLASGGNLSPSADALAQAAKVTSGYTGNGLAVGGSSITLPPVDITASRTGVVNDPNQQIQDALTAAKGAGASGFSAASATADIKLYTTALSNLAAQGETSGTRVNELNEALTKAQHTMSDSLSPAAKLLEAISRQADGENEVAAAWANGAGAAADATAHVKAESEARAFAMPGTAAYTDAVNRLTAAHIAEAAAAQGAQSGAALNDQRQQLQYLQAQTATLNESADTRARDLAVLKEQQTIDKTMPGLAQNEKDALLAGAAAIANQTTALQQTQNALSELGNLATQAFDQVGQSISQAFVTGQGAAVNFGNVARSIISSLVQEIAKLAILNPILNSITGGNNVTLGTVISALSSTGGVATGTSAAGSGGILNLLSTGSSVVSGGSSIAQLFGFQGLGAQISGLADSVGLTGSGGLVSSAGSAISGILNTGTGIGANAASTTAIESLGIDAGGGLGGASIGALAGGVGGGIALGGLSGSLIQGALGKTGPAPLIGAIGGAVSGAIIGSVFPVIGTVLGGIIGGVVGGTGGGFIGPHPASAFSSTGISAENGQLTVGKAVNQLFPTSEPAVQSDADIVNTLLAHYGIQLTSVGGITQIGQNSPGGVADPTKAANVSDAFSGFRFASTDSHLNTFLTSNGGAGFDSADTLNSVAASVQSFVAAVSGTDFAPKIDEILKGAEALGSGATPYLSNIADFVSRVVPGILGTAGQNPGSLATAISGIQAQYAPVLAQAQQLDYKVPELQASQASAISVTQAAVDATYAQQDTSFYLRTVTAQGAISPESLALMSFDAQADQQRAQFSAQLVGTFGDAFKTTQNYATEMAKLETALGAERLAIAQQYTDKLAATATTTITGLASYANKLALGSASPLSPAAQYALATSQFGKVSSAATLGDINGVNGLPTAADAFLSASRVVNGSGVQYAADFASVTQALDNVSMATPDNLTAAVFVTETQSQTQQLVDAIADLKAQLAALNQQVAAGAMLPPRVG